MTASASCVPAGVDKGLGDTPVRAIDEAVFKRDAHSTMSLQVRLAAMGHVNRSLLYVALAATLIVALSAVATAADSLCSDRETVVYSCKVGAKRTKSLSICASKHFSSSSGYLQYRFGRKGALEMVIPKTTEHSDSNPKSGREMYSGGGAEHLRFSYGEVNYVVYTGIGKGWTADGVAVEKDGKVAANINCVGTVTDNGLGNYGAANDDEGFEIPDEGLHDQPYPPRF